MFNRKSSRRLFFFPSGVLHLNPLAKVNLVVGVYDGFKGLRLEMVNSKRQTALYEQKVPVIIPPQCRRLCLSVLGRMIVKRGVWVANCFPSLAGTVFVKWSTIYSWYSESCISGNNKKRKEFLFLLNVGVSKSRRRTCPALPKSSRTQREKFMAFCDIETVRLCINRECRVARCFNKVSPNDFS